MLSLLFDEKQNWPGLVLITRVQFGEARTDGMDSAEVSNLVLRNQLISMDVLRQLLTPYTSVSLYVLTKRIAAES